MLGVVIEEKIEMYVVKTTTKNIWAVAFLVVTQHAYVNMFGCHGLFQWNVDDVWSSSNQRSVAIASLQAMEKKMKCRVWKWEEGEKGKRIEINNGYWFSDKRFHCLTTTDISIRKKNFILF